MKKNKYILVFGLLFVMSLFVNSYAMAGFLRTEAANVDEVTGTFILILYGGRYINDLETIAFLDKEGDPYDIEPYAPEFDYKIKKGLPAGEALSEAKKFVRLHPSYWRSQLRRIIDNEGNTIGYELRPLYYPFVYGIDDLFEVHYKIKDSKVIVYIRLIPDIYDVILFGDMPGSMGGF